MMMRGFRPGLGIVGWVGGAAWALSGCAHYSLPGVRLESPEASGREGQIEIEPIAVITGTNLVERPTLSYPEPDENGVVTGDPVPYAQGSVKPASGGMIGLSPRFEVGLRISPHFPPSLRFKYQFVGEPAQSAPDGNFSASLVAAPGYMMGSDSGVATSFFVADVSVPVGYRLNSHHLFSIVPFFTTASLTGLSVSAADSASGQSISPSQLGAGLGYQLTIQYLFLRTEFAYVLSGSVGDTQISGLKFGALLGLKLK